MYDNPDEQPLQMESTCGSLLSELQKIWNEIGESEIEMDKMLWELEQECLNVYKRKVEHASHSKAQLRQTIADSEAEIAHICSSLGELPLHNKQSNLSLKKELQVITPLLEEMRKKKNEKINQFSAIQNQIHDILKELNGVSNPVSFNENDLSLNKLEDLQNQLCKLQKQKSDRLKQVIDHLNTLKSLCSVLGIDMNHIIHEIHPSLDSSSNGIKSVTLDTVEKLSSAIHRLKELKLQRMKKLQDLGTTMIELWTLMDTPLEEQQMFHHVTKHLGASENEITEAKTLSLDYFKSAEDEVFRLQQIKSIKIKEVLLKKRLYLEEICKGTHLVIDSQDDSDETIDSGAINPSFLLEQIELEISKAKDNALSRKDILEKVEKWFNACEEESWLEEYNRDENRYNAGRGTHLVLKRAEKARALVTKIPAMLEMLSSKVKAWEKERGVEFLYDGVGLMSMLEQYRILKQEKEEEKQRQRDQKKIQGQLMAEKEALFGSIPSPLKSVKKSTTRYSLGGAILQTPYIDKSCKKKSSRLMSTSKKSGKSEIRKPLSPLSSSFSNANNSHVQDEEEIVAINKINTPLKGSLGNDELTQIPTTPSTNVCVVAMQTIMTPVTPAVVGDMEYSFEERRAGVVKV